MTAQDRLAAELIAIGRLAGQRGLLWGTGGNLSARLDDERFLISATGTTLDALTPEDLVLCAVEGTRADGPENASSEIQVHRHLYRRRADVRAVLHLSPLYATLASCADLALPTDLIPESILYLGDVARIPYVPPGSDTLGMAVAAALNEGAAVLMGNHGPVTVGTTPAEALRRMETVEFLARLVLTAGSARITVRGVGATAAEALRHSVYGS
ncbi:MAG TPA: class II aldolase/adducin family protein [Thermomicrobiaceae bacterium]|nr:class II aldolase/adducin family protein [Thermomicrobiaceae bacterium]